MASLNKTMLIGRVGRDPEPRSFANGGKVIKFSVCVNNRKKNQQSGQWEDDPCWIDCEAFNAREGKKLADLIEQYVHKGSQVYVEGHLSQEKWEDKNGGGQRSKLLLKVFDCQFLDSKSQGGSQTAVAPMQQDSGPDVGQSDIPFSWAILSLLLPLLGGA